MLPCDGNAEPPSSIGCVCFDCSWCLKEPHWATAPGGGVGTSERDVGLGDLDGRSERCTGAVDPDPARRHLRLVAAATAQAPTAWASRLVAGGRGVRPVSTLPCSSMISTRGEPRARAPATCRGGEPRSCGPSFVPMVLPRRTIPAAAHALDGFDLGGAHAFAHDRAILQCGDRVDPDQFATIGPRRAVGEDQAPLGVPTRRCRVRRRSGSRCCGRSAANGQFPKPAI